MHARQPRAEPVAVIAPGSHVLLVDVIQQFPQQHRGLALAVVADVAPDVAEVEDLPRAQQRLQEQVAVLGPLARIAGPPVLAHPVELGRLLAARKGPVMQSQHTDHLEGQAAHGAHAAEGHAAAEIASVTGVRAQLLFQPVTHQGHGQGLLQAAGLSGQIRQGIADFLDPALLVLLLTEDIIEQAAQTFLPLAGAARAAQALGILGETGQQPPEPAE